MHFSTVVSVFGALCVASFAGATTLFTQPVGLPATFMTGSTQYIAWTYSGTSASNATLELGQASNEGGTDVQTKKVITTAIVPSSGSYQWTVATDITPGKFYSLKLIVPGEIAAYSGQFVISSGATQAPAAAATTNAPAAAPTATKAASNPTNGASTLQAWTHAAAVIVGSMMLIALV